MIPLPEPYKKVRIVEDEDYPIDVSAYTPNQMRAYAAQCVAEALAAQPAAEPVAHQYLFHSPFGGEVWHDSPRERNGSKPHGHRALYAHPAPAARPAADPQQERTESERFAAYWSSLVAPEWASEELIHACEFCAWYAWRAALAQPAAEPDAQDAKRYRWVKEHPDAFGWNYAIDPAEMERSIDSAMKAKP